ncbi:MAG: SDR family NAD(P)-dependent oxidoreductase [Peptococcaceae bacterium]|nr:SDR family NAD(P)-dependent oxidoreductase [Peptococcaceae bacterium]
MKTIIITGANSGLGFETAKKIAAAGDVQLILACRDMAKAGRAKRAIIDATGNARVIPMQLDTASLDSVAHFAEMYKDRIGAPIDALLCNAGISGSHTGTTKDGYDVIFETNHLGHFLLTQLLLPDMADGGRIFAISSDMHDPFNATLVWNGADALAHPDAALAASGNRYAYSKLCNLYFIYELARKLETSGQHVYANAFNPGLMKTNFMPLGKFAMTVVKTIMPKRFGDLDQSSTALATLAAADGFISGSGNYYDRSTHTCATSDLSYNTANAAELWHYSHDCVKDYLA